MTRRADSIPTQAEEWHRNVDRLLWHDAPEETNTSEESEEQPSEETSTHAQCLAHPSMTKRADK